MAYEIRVKNTTNNFFNTRIGLNNWLWRGQFHSGSKINIITLTKVKLPGGQKNIFNQMGYLMKLTSYKNAICTGIDTNGNNIYEDMKKKLLLEAGQKEESKEFKVGKRPWGERLADNSAIIHHKGKLYLEFIPSLNETETSYNYCNEKSGSQCVNNIIDFDENGESNYYFDDGSGKKVYLKLPKGRKYEKTDVPIQCISFENIRNIKEILN